MNNADGTGAGVVVGITAVLLILLAVYKSAKRIIAFDATGGAAYERLSNLWISHMTVQEFLSEIDRNKRPFRFKETQIAGFTRRYSTQLGAGRYSKVFKGALPNGLAMAVKVFHRDLDVDEGQFMAAVSTMWRTPHVNLVKLFGFCSDDSARALVYEYADHGSLDRYLLLDDGGCLPALFDIAVGVARGIRHLHEESEEKKKVVHYDIKLGNVLLVDGGGALTPKLSGVGLARLVNPVAHTQQVVLTGLPAATRGHVAPEIRVPPDVTEKCDVYSFGVLLLEILGRKRISDEAAAPEAGDQWFPEQAWTNYESGGDLMDLVVVPNRDEHTALVVDDDDVQRWKEVVGRMCKVAFWCIQQRPEARPSMGDVVKMLEGEMDVAPPANPFQDVLAAPVVTFLRTKMASGGTR